MKKPTTNPVEIEDLEDLEFEVDETPGAMILMPGPSTSPTAPATPPQGVNLGAPFVRDVEKALMLDETDLEATQKIFLIAYATYGTPTQAARASGISIRNHTKWLKESEEYAEAFQLAFDTITDKIEETSLTATMDPLNVRERMFHLENRRPERYARVKKIQLGGSLDVKHTLADLMKQAHNNGMLEED